VYFILEGYINYETQITTKFPELSKYFGSSLPDEEPIQECSVEEIKHEFLEEESFYSLITLKKNDSTLFKVTYFGCLDGFPSYLILKEIFEESQTILKNMKINDQIKVKFDGEFVGGTINKISTENLWENLYVKWDDNTSLNVSTWETISEINLPCKFDPIFSNQLCQRIDAILQSNKIDLKLNPNSHAYAINFEIMIQRIKNGFYRSKESCKMDFNHLINHSNSPELQKVFKEFFENPKIIFNRKKKEEDMDDDFCDCKYKCDEKCINFSMVNSL
jgi:hypothetical protein